MTPHLLSIQLCETDSSKTIELLKSHDFDSRLTEHGLQGNELRRKIRFWEVDFNNYKKNLKRFDKYFKGERNREQLLTLVKQKENYTKLSDDQIPEIEKLCRLYTVVKKYLNKFLQSSDIIFDSLADVFPLLGAASEIKQSLESVTQIFRITKSGFIKRLRIWLDTFVYV